jgi:hypothetical protein
MRHPEGYCFWCGRWRELSYLRAVCDTNACTGYPDLGTTPKLADLRAMAPRAASRVETRRPAWPPHCVLGDGASRPRDRARAIASARRCASS